MQTQASLDNQRFLKIVPEPGLRKFIEDNPMEPISEAFLRTRDKFDRQAEYIALLEKEMGKHAGFLFAHGVVADQQDVALGEFLRAEIAKK